LSLDFSKRAFACGLLILSFLLIPSSLVFGSSNPTPASLAPSAAGYSYQVLSGRHTAIGPQQVLVILVDFQDVHHAKSAQEMQNVAINQLNGYYGEVSYGKLTITGQVYGWYTVSHTMGYYGHDSKDPGDDDNARQLAKDAVALLPPSVDLTPFKFLMIVHAGKDQAADQSDVKSDEIWSSCSCSVFPNYEEVTPIYAHGKAFSNFIFLSELDGYGTFAHEMGHALGLPDLYKYPSSESKSYVGYWSLMDHGNWCCYNRAQSTPSYIDAWGAALLGWLTPAIADPKALVSSFDLKPLESPSASAILIPVFPSTYYFIEYRTKTGSDSHLPGSGILVYYVNERLDSGKGIVQLMNPKTGDLFPAQDEAENLDAAVFKLTDRFRDPGHRVYLMFLGGGNDITTLFSTQEVTASIVQSMIIMPQTSLSGMYNDKLSLIAKLLDQSGSPIAGQTVEIDVLGPTDQWQRIGSVSTDQSGGISFEIPLNYALGQYSFRFFYPGGKGATAWFLSSEADFSVNIEPGKMILALSSTSIAFGRTSATVTVTDSHGAPLADVLVTVFVNDIQQGSVRTDQNGKAMFPLQFTFADIGPRTVTVKADANNYLSTQTSGSVFVFALWLIPLIAALIAAPVGIVVWRSRGKQKKTSDSTRA